MRMFAFVALAAASLAVSMPQAASAAELGPQAEACPPNSVWDDGVCVRVRPRSYAYAPAPVVVAPPVYVAPPPAVVVGAPLVVAPALGFGFYAGPRWGWGPNRVVVNRTVVHRTVVHGGGGRHR